MIFILVCSLVAISVVVHRLLSLRWETVLPRTTEDMVERFRNQPTHEQFNYLVNEVAPRKTPMARVLVTALELREEPPDTIQAGVEAVARQEVVGLQRGLAVLEVVITIAPLLGLLGTVSGLVSVFGVIGESSILADPDHAQIARGIGEALYTTIGGMAVAVPVVIAHSYLTKRIEGMAVQMELLAGQVIQAARSMVRSQDQNLHGPVSGSTQAPVTPTF
ncbi:MAG: MotA/TolQ/ExbB proton channel family protein [Verrucomicrobiota bacterium]